MILIEFFDLLLLKTLKVIQQFLLQLNKYLCYGVRLCHSIEVEKNQKYLK